jgi:hypothetical protein
MLAASTDGRRSTSRVSAVPARAKRGPSMQHPRQGAPRHGSGRGQSSIDRCSATVTLPGTLYRSLAAAANTSEVAPVLGCALQRGHRGRHQGRACSGPGEHCWLRWDEWGFRLGRAQPRNPAPRHAPTRARHRVSDAACPPAAAQPAAVPQPPESRSQLDALWAIAAALTRLAEVVDAASRPSR